MLRSAILIFAMVLTKAGAEDALDVCDVLKQLDKWKGKTVVVAGVYEQDGDQTVLRCSEPRTFRIAGVDVPASVSVIGPLREGESSAAEHKRHWTMLKNASTRNLRAKSDMMIVGVLKSPPRLDSYTGPDGKRWLAGLGNLGIYPAEIEFAAYRRLRSQSR